MNRPRTPTASPARRQTRASPPLDDVPLAWLRLFCRVIELGSFSAAARGSGLSQPAASRQVASLEERLGVSLLMRSTRRVTATDAGRVLYEQLREILWGVDHLGEELLSLAHGLTGLLRVAAPSAFGRRFLVPVVNRFLLDHPHTQIELLLSDRRVDLVELAVDLAVRIGPLPESTPRARLIGRSGLVAVASPRRLASLPKPVTWATLAALPALLPIPAPPTIGPLELKRLDVRLQTDDLEALLAAVLADVGVTLLPPWLVSPHLERGELVRLLDVPLPESPIHLVYTGGARPRSALVSAFSDRVVSALEVPGTSTATR